MSLLKILLAGGLALIVHSLPAAAKTQAPQKREVIRKPAGLHPSIVADYYVLGGFLRSSKDKRYYILDSGRRRYYLKRKKVFIENQPEIKRRKPHQWIRLRIQYGDVVKTAPSKLKSIEDVL